MDDLKKPRVEDEGCQKEKGGLKHNLCTAIPLHTSTTYFLHQFEGTLCPPPLHQLQ